MCISARKKNLTRNIAKLLYYFAKTAIQRFEAWTEIEHFFSSSNDKKASEHVFRSYFKETCFLVARPDPTNDVDGCFAHFEFGVMVIGVRRDSARSRLLA